MLRAFVRDLRASHVLQRSGNGAFVYSCNERCGAHTAECRHYKLGDTTMRDAIAKWWRADNAPSGKHRTCHAS